MFSAAVVAHRPPTAGTKPRSPAAAARLRGWFRPSVGIGPLWHSGKKWKLDPGDVA